MKDQRNSIGDRAAPVDAPESSEVPDPSISKVDGGVERPEATEPAPHNNGATPYPLEAKVMAELMARGTNPTMLKTLNELDMLGRPGVGVLRSLFTEKLIPGGYVEPVATTRDGLLKSVQRTEKIHEGAAELIAHLQAKVIAKVAAANDPDPETLLRREVSRTKLLNNAAREARCAHTQGDHDLRDQIATKLKAWIALEWKDGVPTYVSRRLERIEQRCTCYLCRADRSEAAIAALVKEMKGEADGPFVELDVDMVRDLIREELARQLNGHGKAS